MRKDKRWQTPIKILIAEHNGFLFYYDGFTVEKHQRVNKCDNNIIKRYELTIEDYRYLDEIEYKVVYASKQFVGGRPARSFNVNLYGSSDLMICLPYHYTGK